jgi:hypothetical protein
MHDDATMIADKSWALVFLAMVGFCIEDGTTKASLGVAQFFFACSFERRLKPPWGISRCPALGNFLWVKHKKTQAG